STVIAVMVNRENLTAGNYTGKIAITSDGGNSEVTVNLSVAGASILSVSPIALDFGTTTNNLSLTITNIGGDSLKWNVSENPDQPWLLAITPNSGVLLAQQSATVQVTVSRTGLATQDYTTNLQVSSNGGEMAIPVKLTIPQPSANIRRVSCGRTSSYTDLNGQIWESDRAYSAGSWGYLSGNSYTTSHAIANTQDDPIYQSHRWGLQGYQFDLANGTYQVTLHFAEVYCTRAGQRIFSVEIEKQRVLSNYDIYAEVGHDYATQKSYSVSVTDNQLNLDFKTYVESPMISAIEIQTLSSLPNLAVTPMTLAFGTSLTSLSFTVTNNGGGALSWTAAENPEAAWLTSISPTNGTLAGGSSATVTVQLDRTGLTEGTYTTPIAITSNAGNQTVTVNMSVAQNPALSVISKTLDFGTTTTSLSLALTNSGAGTLTWSAVENPEVTWLTALNPANGSLSAQQTVNLVVTVDRTGLTDGSYSGKININSNGGNQEITVNLQVVSTVNAVWRVNCGSSQNYTDGAGNVWESDRSYTTGNWGAVGGGIYSTSSPIGSTSDDPLYQTEHWGMNSYRFDLANGVYNVTLCFAEIYCRQSKQRIFQVELEGQVVLNNFDIYAEVGFARALQKIFQVNVTDGQLNIRFRAIVEDPKISAIQVQSQAGSQMLAKSTGEPATLASAQFPTQFVLHQNYPNPFNPVTHISFELPESRPVRLLIYNLMGQYVTELVNGELTASSYQYEWTATDHRGDAVPNGVYFAVLQSGHEKKIIKMTYMK
ncbi:T9SS type A sorting domain-containing protein, partial [candidate division KSB1 bacterium]|nr:T9SS type A sorting domain-containing protein [candidate division KSB1 bacterium]